MGVNNIAGHIHSPVTFNAKYFIYCTFWGLRILGTSISLVVSSNLHVKDSNFPNRVIPFQVKAVKPDVLLGLSGVGGLFTQQVCIPNSSVFMHVMYIDRGNRIQDWNSLLSCSFCRFWRQWKNPGVQGLLSFLCQIPLLMVFSRNIWDQLSNLSIYAAHSWK